MARIICISKFPPLSGGIAAKTYWLVRALAERGHTIHVVTDWLGVDETYSYDCVGYFLPHNILIHRAEREKPWIIPDDSHRALSLFEKAMEVVQNHSIDIIDSTYLVPYGLVGHLVSQSTGLPHICLHGGSDIQKYVAQGIWPNLWRELFKKASVVITDDDNQHFIKPIAKNSKILTPYVPNPRFFTAVGRQVRERPILALIGKANYYWQHKSWHRVIDIWSTLDDGFEFLIISQGNGFDDFKRFVHERLGDKVSWRRFIPPWQMPNLLKSIDGLFCFQSSLPFPSFSNIALEALSCGTSLFIDEVGFQKYYLSHRIDLSIFNSLLVPLITNDSIPFHKKIKDQFNHIHEYNHCNNRLGYDIYISEYDNLVSYIGE